MARKITRTRTASLPPLKSAAEQRAENIFLAFALIVLVLIVFIPAYGAGFIWDDDQLLTANPQVHSANGWWTLWLQPQTADYFPLTSTTLWLEWRLWGMAPYGYHVTNVVLHAIVALLSWRTLARLRIPGAWVAAAIFAVHPVCVESVAWISERKNTISQIFFLLSIMSYLKYEAETRARSYVFSIIFFILSLLAKTSVVMLPFVLLLLAWWKRGTQSTEDAFTYWKRAILRTVPYFLAALVLGLVTIYFQYGRAIGTEVIPIGTMPQRVASACFAAGFYLYSALFPYNLMVIYPQWHLAGTAGDRHFIPYYLQVLPGLAIAALLAWCWVRRSRLWARSILLSLGYFLITLLPALGLLKMSYMRLTLVADHFQYLSIIGVIALVVAWASTWSWKMFRITAAGAFLLIFSVLSFGQTEIYRSEEALWSATLEKNPDTWQGHNHLGAALYMRGDIRGAYPHFAKAVELKPENPESHNNLGLALMQFGHMDEAIHQYETAVSIKDDSSMRTNLANAYAQVKQFDKAIDNYQQAIHMNPENTSAMCNMGYALMQEGRLDDAMEQFQNALKADPNSPQARNDLDLVRRAKGLPPLYPHPPQPPQ